MNKVIDRISRFALLIACDTYNDPNLSTLKAPVVDIERLAMLLRDPKIGGYDVKPLINKSHSELTREIETFFIERQKDDVSFLYFAGHGHKGRLDGHLYLATIDSDLNYLRSTTIPGTFINEVMQYSPSKRRILMLDCCFSEIIQEFTVGVEEIRI